MDDCTAVAGDTETLVPPVVRRRRQALLGNWQAAVQAVTLFLSVISLTMSAIVFMVLLYTPASSPLAQARNVHDLRTVSNLQREMISRLQREANYLDARQKVLESALSAAGLVTDDIRSSLDGIERALTAKTAEDDRRAMAAGLPKLIDIPIQPEIQLPQGDEVHFGDGQAALIGPLDGSDALIGRPDGHELRHQDPKSGESGQKWDDDYNTY